MGMLKLQLFRVWAGWLPWAMNLSGDGFTWISLKFLHQVSLPFGKCRLHLGFLLRSQRQTCIDKSLLPCCPLPCRFNGIGGSLDRQWLIARWRSLF